MCAEARSPSRCGSVTARLSSEGADRIVPLRQRTSASANRSDGGLRAARPTVKQPPNDRFRIEQRAVGDAGPYTVPPNGRFRNRSDGGLRAARPTVKQQPNDRFGIENRNRQACSLRVRIGKSTVGNGLAHSVPIAEAAI